MADSEHGLDLADVVVSYIGLITLATISIYSGSFASLPALKKQKDPNKPEDQDEDDEEPVSEEIRLEDAYWFPIIGSVVLLGLYLFIKYVSTHWINILLQWYFSVITVASVWNMLLGAAKTTVGAKRWRALSHLTLTLNHDSDRVFRLHYPVISLGLLPLALYPSVTYMFFPAIMKSQYSLLMDIMGLSLSFMALSTIKVDSLMTGVVLLSGLFLYDIWWVFGSKPVFGTSVMVAVAQGLDAPIKILWPKSKYIFGSNDHTMLGLGDIVVPGMFIALALRYDLHLSTHRDFSKPFAKPFFTATLLSYILGLATTVLVMHNFQSAQPALLYLSPACISAFLFTGWRQGVSKEMWQFSDTKEKQEKEATKTD
ncbi:hypothetical protein M408DRAFT_327119 [Serendipita vermifera MAFF 305830]|uniref:Peptidase A22B, signal peptide peptidase n=1 Tax=Serendipita vermifera MAFF 305830 TaxID=933852 RepID=A0A0C3BJL0_SERVB|nr:hypothetical protein M408DRAFT_327119 [Serendipita vermifera MAFF 305830]